MALYSKFLGAAELHQTDGGITPTFAKNAGIDMGVAPQAVQTMSVDPGFDPGLGQP